MRPLSGSIERGAPEMDFMALDVCGAENAGELHDRFAAALQAPAWYGRNLDALYDLLCARSERTGLRLVFSERGKTAEFARYLRRARRVCADAAAQNPLLLYEEWERTGAEKTAAVFVFDGYADWEPAYLCAELRGAGCAVRTVGPGGAPVRSMGGFCVTPDFAAERLACEFDLLVLPGGKAWSEGKNDSVLSLVARSVRRGVPVGAICDAAGFLAAHGFLDRVRHTGNTLAGLKALAPGYRGEALFEERQAVSDGGIVTANGSAALEFARALLLLLGVKTEEELEAWYRLHKRGFYPS